MPRIPTLDGWRAVAIAAVTIHHLVWVFYTDAAGFRTNPARYGAFGVDIFFGLSGLLITKLLLEERQASGEFNLRGFYLRRIFRILPPYFAFLAVCTGAGLMRSSWEVLGSVFLFRNYLPDNLAGPATQHLWSLAVEEHFYLLWPAVLFLLKPARARTAAFLMAIGVALWRLVESQMTPRTLPWLLDHFRTDLRLDALLWGCVFAFLLIDAKERAKLTEQLRWPAWTFVAAVWLMSVYFYSTLTSVLVACAAPILLLGTLTHPRWLLSRVLESAPFVWLGRISYSLYLWQLLFLVPGWDHPAHWWNTWPLNVPACFAAAAASYYWIEKPFIRLGRRLASARNRGERLAINLTSPTDSAV